MTAENFSLYDPQRLLGAAGGHYPVHQFNYYRLLHPHVKTPRYFSETPITPSLNTPPPYST